ncbi:MAG TPA: bifunctional methionine sulfoxide reductase B/A protein [Tepidisphaeraceae bacterium]|nr:bifunctional methionine sulfoxide reductase B/A protein [Tepidisphaeraceae bacterium]
MRVLSGMRTLTLLILSLLLTSCDRPPSANAASPNSSDERNPMSTPTARIRVITKDGKLSDPIDAPKLVLSDAEWQKRLTPAQYKIGRAKGTEPAFCGGLLNNHEAGVYFCIGCNLPLFSSDSKFESGSGWPSFFQPISRENVHEEVDRAYGMVRTEIICNRCDMHLGHVFDDGPRPTGLRYCLNSEVMKFLPTAKLATLAEDPTALVAAAAAISKPTTKPTTKAASAARAEAVFAGGCFWCVEAVFEELDGVSEAISGYAGGSRETANYEAVCTGATGHAEAVKIIYDPTKISYEKLLEVHFATHDPTTLNRQGNDTGPQYRSAIFYATEKEKELAQAFIDDVNASKHFPRPVVTTLEPLKAFYPAEAYHQNYACQNPRQGYIAHIALPKVDKVREKYKDLVKPQSPIPGR